MLVILNNPNGADLTKNLSNIKLTIFKRIMRYGFKPEDFKLSKYLKTKYKLTLRAAALYVYHNISYNINKDNNIIIITTSNKADRLARIINYGTMISGKSDILKYAFAKK